MVWDAFPNEHDLGYVTPCTLPRGRAPDFGLCGPRWFDHRHGFSQCFLTCAERYDRSNRMRLVVLLVLMTTQLVSTDRGFTALLTQ